MVAPWAERQPQQTRHIQNIRDDPDNEGNTNINTERSSFRDTLINLVSQLTSNNNVNPNLYIPSNEGERQLPGQ